MNEKTSSLGYGNLLSGSIVYLRYQQQQREIAANAAQQKLQDAKDKAEASKSEKSVDGKEQDAK